MRAFQSLAKLVLVRRIVKALVTHHGLYRVQRGMRAPIVVDLTVREMSWCDETGKNKPGGVELLRIHTVAPSTAAAVEGFRLGSIEESPSNSSSPRAADQHWKKRGKTRSAGEERPPRDDVVRVTVDVFDRLRFSTRKVGRGPTPR